MLEGLSLITSVHIMNLDSANRTLKMLSLVCDLLYFTLHMYS